MQLQFSWLGKLHCFCYHSSEVTIKLNQERSCSFRISMDTVCYAELPWERNWLWVPFPYISDWFVAAFWSLETGSRWKRFCTFCSIHRNVSSELGVEYELWTMNFIIESRGCVVLLDELITMTTKTRPPNAHFYMMTSSNGNFVRVIGPLCGELLTGHRWIPLTKASGAEPWYFFICAWTNGKVNNWDASGWCHRAHYDVTVMLGAKRSCTCWHHSHTCWFYWIILPAVNSVPTCRRISWLCNFA